MHFVDVNKGVNAWKISSLIIITDVNTQDLKITNSFLTMVFN